MTNNKLKYLKKHLAHLIFYNTYTPFPFFDTEYVEGISNKIEEMKKDNKVDYDSLPVEACKFCNGLHIVVDEFDNDICTRCGSINETIKYDNIDKFLNKTKKAC